MGETRYTEPLAQRISINVTRADGSINPDAIARILELLENQSSESVALPLALNVTSESKDILQPNPKRLALWFQNTTAVDIHLGFGWEAKTNLPFKVFATEGHLLFENHLTRAKVSAVHGSAGTTVQLYVVEFVKP